MKYLFSLILFTYCAVVVQGQDTILVKNIGWGIEAQLYPTGFIGGAVIIKEVSRSNFIHARLGYNLVRHGDAGLHEDERGSGFGLTVGYDYALAIGKTHVLLGARCDVWQNAITWTNNIGSSIELSGKSKVTVVQPTLRLSYPVRVGSDFIIPEIAFGSEINVYTKGDDVGEGIILLIGFSYVIP